MLAWTREPEEADFIAAAMRGTLAAETGLEADFLTFPVGAPGARIVGDGEAS